MTRVGLHVAEATDEDRKSWDAFVATSADAEAGHQWAFGEILADVFGLKILRLVAWRETGIAAVLPLVIQQSFLGTFLTSVPYLNYAGIAGADAEARTALAAEADRVARSLAADRLELRGRDGSDLPLACWTGKATYGLSLPSSKEDLWKRLGSKVRSQVKRPSKEGFEARVDVAGGQRFYDLFSRKWKELGSPTLPRGFFERMEHAFGDRFAYILVERGSETAAAGVLLASGNRVEIPWAASHVDHDRLGVNMLLYWASLEFAVERGAREFDFGRSTPDTGNARFKLQWGATQQPLVWNVVTASGSGRAHERGDARRGIAAWVWRRLPLPLTRRIGPWLAARIPY